MKTARQLMDEAQIHGTIGVSSGVVLMIGKEIIEEQVSWGEDDDLKHKKFHDDCFYLVSDDGHIDHVDEDELADFLNENG